MPWKLKWVWLLTGLLAGCASHQVTEKAPGQSPPIPMEAVQVQVNFAIPAHSDYLAAQLVEQLTQKGLEATLLTDDARATPRPGVRSALLQLTLTGTWTETYISRRTKHRRSLTQMRGRIPRESPRFRSEVRLQDSQTDETVWQSEIISAGQWYFDFNDMARSLAKRVVQQLHREGLLVASAS